MTTWSRRACAALLALFAPSAVGEVTTLNSNARALGMGEAFTAVARDYSALFYNPAGLNHVDQTHLTLAKARAGASGFDAIKNISKLTKGGASTEYAGTVGQLYGQGAWTGLGVESALEAPGFAVAVIDHADARVRVDNPVYPSIYTGVYNDFGYVAGFGLPLTRRLNFGAALRLIKRTGAKIPFGAAALADLDPEVVKSRVTGWGRGFGADVSAEYNLPTRTTEITAVGAWRNVGQTHFRSNDPATHVPYDDNDVTLGLAARREFWWGLGTFAVDYRYANDAETQLLGKFNFGLELDFPLLDIRGGFREGYASYGAGLDLGIISVDAASYGVELGAYPGQLEDRRYVAEFTLRLDVDETFRPSSRRGRLKQRR